VAAESLHLNTWLYGLLSGDATLATAMQTLATAAYDGVTVPSVTWANAWYPDAAPLNSPRVFGLWQWIALPDDWAWGSRMQRNYRLRAFVVAPVANPDLVLPVADRLDTLLESVNGSVTGYSLTCRRISEYSRREDLQGVRWLHAGGLYAVHVWSV
jgi:hypothetical protein